MMRKPAQGAKQAATCAGKATMKQLPLRLDQVGPEATCPASLQDGRLGARLAALGARRNPTTERAYGFRSQRV